MYLYIGNSTGQLYHPTPNNHRPENACPVVDLDIQVREVVSPLECVSFFVCQWPSRVCMGGSEGIVDLSVFACM